MQISLILVSTSISTILFAPHKERLNATCTVHKVLYNLPNETIGKQHTLKTKELQINKNESE